MTAAAAQLKIINLALAHLGESQVDTLDLDDTSEAARKLLPFLDTVRDQVLAGHGWRAAMAYDTLPDSGDAAGWKYGYVLHLPGDCLRVWEVDPDQRPVAWERAVRQLGDEERAVILSDKAPLNIAYVRRIGWDGIPVELYAAMAAWTASMGAMPIQGDGEKSARLMKLAGELVAKAAAGQGTQAGGQQVLVESGFASLRRGV